MKISLRHVHTADGTHCTAIEDIRALAKHPNGWMFEDERRECEHFAGTEDEAVALRTRLEKACSSRLATWESYQ